MNTDPDYKRFQFSIADLLAIMVIVAVLGGFSRLPASPWHVIPLLGVLYVVKYRILTLRVQPWLTLLLYFGVALALLPYLYFRVAVETSQGLVDPLAYIIGTIEPLAVWMSRPIAVFTVPTVSFAYDVFSRRQPSWPLDVLRSWLEIVLVFPVWVFVWMFVEVMMGWLRFPLLGL
jgi:hypothetical protein